MPQCLVKYVLYIQKRLICYAIDSKYGCGLFINPSGQGSGDIQLSQPFTNFAKILFCFSNDYADNAVMLQLDSKSFDFIMSNTTLNKNPTLIAHGGYWRFQNYANGSTTTLLKQYDESGVFFWYLGSGILIRTSNCEPNHRVRSPQNIIKRCCRIVARTAPGISGIPHVYQCRI